jgi:hypothetical protein
MATKSKSKDQEDFPGYPHYPANEDIMNTGDIERVSLDVENLSRSRNAVDPALNKSSGNQESENIKPRFADDDADDIADDNNDPETAEANLTEDDFIALGEDDGALPKSLALDGNDLDIPGAEDDDDNEEIGEEDEENNYYSLGGDAHENLDEDRGTE